MVENGRRPIWIRYGIALLAVAIAIAGRALVQYLGGGPYRFPILQLAIIVAAFYGGWGPGLLAVGLTTVAWAWFLPPAGTFRIDHSLDMVNLAMFAGLNVLIVWAFSAARQQLWPLNRAVDRRRKSALDYGVGGAETLRSKFQRDRVIEGRRRHRMGRRLFAATCILGGILAVFGCWGTFTNSGSAHFEDEAWLVPLVALASAPAMIIVAIAFLPVHSVVGDLPETDLPDRTGP